MGRQASLSAVALALAFVIAPGCGSKRELLVVVDTDMMLGFDADADPSVATTASFDRLRIELLAPGEASAGGSDHARDFIIGPGTAWPLTFAVGEGDSGEDLARIRIRAWRYGNELREPGTPTGPAPPLTVDRLAIVPIPSSDKDTIRIVLRGECLGAPPDPTAETTCVTTPAEMKSARDAVEHVSSIASSERGTWSRIHTKDCARAAPASAICVGGGLFVRGDDAFSDVSEGVALLRAGPRHVVDVTPFFLDRTEYTVARYRAAKLAGATPPRPTTTAEPSCTWTDAPGDKEDVPLTCVTAETAHAACVADGGELVTDAQWEWAARGPRVVGPYVWGTNEARCCAAKLAASFGCAGDVAPAAADHVADASCGASDFTSAGIIGLAGNVRELVLDAAFDYGNGACPHGAILDDPSCLAPGLEHAARGGSFRSTLDLGKTGARSIAAVTEDVGFRCAYRGAP